MGAERTRNYTPQVPTGTPEKTSIPKWDCEVRRSKALDSIAWFKQELFLTKSFSVTKLCLWT
jgi:hypothetical protein